MPEISRLNGGDDCFELDFLEREATPESAMKLGIRLHLAGLSLSDTVSTLDTLGIDCCRSTVHNWVQKADLQPLDGADPDHVAVDETVIRLNTERYWLYAAVDFSELREKHLVDDAVFLVDRASWLRAACHRHELRFQHETQGIGTASNGSFEK